MHLQSIVLLPDLSASNVLSMRNMEFDTLGNRDQEEAESKT